MTRMIGSASICSDTMFSYSADMGQTQPDRDEVGLEAEDSMAWLAGAAGVD